MRLFPTETFLTYKTRLKSDIWLLCYWDLDSRGKPECLGEFVRVGKGDPVPLKTPVLAFRPPRISGTYDKREFAILLEGYAEERRPYLDRVGNVLAKNLGDALLGNAPFKPAEPGTPSSEATVSDKLRTLAFLFLLLF